MNLEQIPNLNVTLDSETARAIAEQYLRFRYIETFTAVLLTVALFTALAYVAMWIVKRL